MRWAQVVRDVAIVRDASCGPQRRAYAAAALASGEDDVPSATVADPATRMFGYDTRHDEALPWDGRSMRSGTITYLDEKRVEQYVGQQRWIAYSRADLDHFRGDIGDQVRIAARGSGVAVEAIGPNRLQESRSTAGREAFSGMVILRATEIGSDEIEALARSVAERFAASMHSDSGVVRLEFRGAAALRIKPTCPRPDEVFAASVLMTERFVAAVRLDVAVRSNKLDAALDAERALMLLAAMLSSEAESIAVDDTGAIFSAEQLYVLGTRNEMRADAFAFAAAACRRQWPAPQEPLSGRRDVFDELTVFSTRPWRAEFAVTFLERELVGLAEAARYNDDPVVPAGGQLFSSAERAEPGTLERVATLSYDSVDIDVGFLDVTCARDDVRSRVDARKDIAALLGGPIAHAIVIAFGNRVSDAELDGPGLEIRRAETVATALAAAFARRDASVTSDALGALYSPDDLQVLALRRCGKSLSWNARVASVAALSHVDESEDLRTPASAC